MRSVADPIGVAAEAQEREALEWLFAFADQERGVGWNPAASADEQWKLGRTRALLDLAGAPDRRLLCVLVAGTKGKGSTAAWLASILSAAGVGAGLYSKPHLQRYRERIRVDGAIIPARAFAEGVARFRGYVDELRRRHPAAGEPTTFEVTTALALDHFARSRCRVAVVEVGLGGRLDATNSVDPVVSIITSISRDHTAILGRTLAAIASEKAGILRPGIDALLAEQRPAAARALRRACGEIRARCRTIPPLPVTDGEAALVPAAAGDGWRRVRLPLAGAHQRQNAALAVAAARALGVRGIDVSDSAVALGLARLRWPGRFEVADGAPPVVLDGAHNDASAAALAQTLAAYAARRPVHLVLGLHRDKDASAVLRPLLARAATVWTAAMDSPRALAAEEVAVLCRRLTSLPVRACGSVADALRRAREAAADGGVVCVTGSLGVVGEARDALRLRPVQRLWRREDGASQTPPRRERGSPEPPPRS